MKIRYNGEDWEFSELVIGAIGEHVNMFFTGVTFGLGFWLMYNLVAH